MKVVFFGGGAHRTLPIVRSALAAGKVFAGGEIVLHDLDVSRAETMGRMIAKTPEFAACPCKITWGTSLDRALDGADAVHVVLMAGSPLSYQLGLVASRRHGFLGSDNVSQNGAFLALKGGELIMGLARRMEKRCPDAWLLLFANPVAVLSAAVNNHTKIRAAGICDGFRNHMWDLTRLMGEDAFRTDYDVDAAGINHGSIILRGKCRGRDLYEVLGEHLTDDWRPPKPRPEHAPFWKSVVYGLRRMIELYRKFGHVFFSMEFDGMAHLFYEKMYEDIFSKSPILSAAQVRAAVRAGKKGRDEANARFRAHLDGDPDAKFWSAHESDPALGRADEHISVRILKGIAGMGPQKIAVSRPTRGAVAGFKDRTVLEFSQIIDRRSIKPVPDLAIPDPFHGMASAVATHQTVLADAVATGDPRTLYHALNAYPIRQGSRASQALFLELLKINRDEIPKSFQGAKDYFTGMGT